MFVLKQQTHEAGGLCSSGIHILTVLFGAVLYMGIKDSIYLLGLRRTHVPRFSHFINRSKTQTRKGWMSAGRDMSATHTPMIANRKSGLQEFRFSLPADRFDCTERLLTIDSQSQPSPSLFLPPFSVRILYCVDTHPRSSWSISASSAAPPLTTLPAH